jgi:uncharacterized membrane protein
MGKHMEKKSKLAKIINLIIKIFWIFVIGSIFGFFAEMLYTAIYTRTFVIRKGLIYGPFIQIYGMGAIAYYLLISKVKEPKDAFFAGMIMGGILEYICSFFQEIIFGTISWDYSNFFLNFNGRTCILYCFYWGIIAVVFLKIVYPWFEKMEPLIYKKNVRIITVFLILFMAFDISISSMAAYRQKQIHKDIPESNKIDEFLDKTYPDEYLDRIYNNKKEIN